MAGKRKNGEGSYGEKVIKGVKYKYYRDSDGKYTYGRTQKELKEKIERKKNEQPSNHENLLTVGEYSVKWLDKKKSTIKPKTYDGYEYIINIICDNRFVFGGMQIKSVKKEQVQSFLDDLAGTYARSTITKTRTILRQIFSEAIDDSILLENPILKSKVPIEDNVTKKTKEIVILEKDDIRKFVKEADCVNGDGTHTPVGKIGTPIYGVCGKMAVFILNTGMRASEAIDLKWENVNIEKKQVHVKTASPYIKNRDKNATTKYKLQSGTPKTKKGSRTIPLSEKAVEILKWCDDNRKPGVDYVFTTDNGTRVLNSNLDKTIVRMLNRAGCSVQKCGSHALRHTFASQLLASGVDIQVVSKLLGHSKVSTTYNVYIHLLDKQPQEAIEALNNAMKFN